MRAEVLLHEDHPDVRDYAATLNDQQVDMAQMSEKFRQLGNEVYVQADAVKESNRVL